MSRNYEVNVKIKGIDKEVIEKYFKENFNSTIDLYEECDTGILEGTIQICLTVGIMDYNAHNKISEYFKAINAQALVQTQWTDLENLPYEEYGDTFDGEDFFEEDE